MQNKVTLLGYYGGDDSHSLSAWQSTNLELDIELSKNIKERIHQLFEATVVTKKKDYRELLKMLAENNHHTPFEKSCLHFQIRGDIASHIHCLKHRLTSINSESARYKELGDKWYLPDDYEWYENIKISEEDTYLTRSFVESIEKKDRYWRGLLHNFTRLSHELYHKAVSDLTPKLGRTRAKESARYFLNYNKQLDFDIMFNFRSFAHFQELRNSHHAQLEIREIARMMLEQVKAIPGNPFQYTLEAFGM